MILKLNTPSALSAGLFLGLLCVGTARANTITGSVYKVTDAQAGNATPGTVASLTTGPVVTFSTNSPLDFNSNPNFYTIGSFLQTNPGGSTILSGSSNLSDSMNDTLFNFAGVVTVTNGESFTAQHDDGVTLIIDGITVIGAGGPSQANQSMATYTGPSGTYAFQLVYGECCDAPAILDINLPFANAAVAPQVTPEPSSLLLLSSGLLGLGTVVRRRTLG